MAELIASEVSIEEERGVLLRALRQHQELENEPTRITELRKDLPERFRLPEEQIEEIVTDLVQQGKVFRFEPYNSRGAKKRYRYWFGNPEEYAALLIQEQLSKKVRTRSELKAAIKNRLGGFSESRRDQLIKKLIEEGTIRELPPFLGGRTKRLSLGKPNPQEYLQHAVDKIQHLLTRYGITEQEVSKVLFQMIGSSASSPSQIPPVEKPQQSTREPLSQKILQRAAELESGVSGSVISVRELRQASDFLTHSKQEFDQALLKLAEEEKVYLHRHDRPMGLSESDREQLVFDGKNNYYSSVSVLD
ncbi:Hypothetical protein PBC10988_2790 [Planctomycetales bacterium 10988]|nr:Hypothetical protein PBC10988_2790 [Planctomycetales bacterium 10988]